MVIDIAGRRIGAGARCLIIAEAGVNHDGSPERAHALVAAAAAAGADAVKFQTFRAEDLVTASARKAAYQVAATGADDGQLTMLKGLELPLETFRALKEDAEARGLLFLSTPFDLGSARFLADLGMPALKVPSGELTNLPFLAALAAFGLPMLVSTGMGDLAEVEDAVAIIRAHGAPPLALFHCVSAYPAPPAAYNLRALDTMRAALGVPVGLSDHTQGFAVALAAVARGADLVEKHLTLDCTLPGPDHAASLEPAAFTDLVAQIRAVEAALGDGIKRPAPCERDVAQVARRSVVVARDLPAGHRLASGDLVLKRPASGIAPRELTALPGRVLKRPVAADQALAWDDLT